MTLREIPIKRVFFVCKDMFQFLPVHCLILVLLSCLLACNTPKKSKSTPRSQNPTQTEKPKSEKTETTKEPETKETTPVPDKSNEPKQEAPKLTPKSTIDIAIALPLDGSYDASRFAHFVNGLGIDLHTPVSQKPIVKLHVISIGNKNSETELSIIPDIQKADFIVGGYQTSQVKALASIAQSKKVPYLSVWNTTEDLTIENPYYIQLKPGLNHFVSYMAEFIATDIRPDKIFVLIKSASSKDNSTINALKKVLSDYNRPYEIINVETEGHEGWRKAIYADKKLAFIIPNWDDKAYVTATLKAIHGSRREAATMVAGMPQWLEFDQIDFSLFEALQVHIPKFNYVDLEDYTNKQFATEYFKLYNMVADEEAFYGQDIRQITGRLAKARSEGLAFSPNQLSGKYFSYYDVKEVRMEKITDKNMHPQAADYLMNKYLAILKFEGGSFVPVR